MKRKNILIGAAAGVVALSICLVGISFYKNHMDVDPGGDIDDISGTQLLEGFSKNTGNTQSEDPDNYIGQTAYDDSVEISKDVFKYPFQKTQGYINNKTLLQELDIETVQKYEECAKDFAELYLGTSYRAVEGNEEDYADSLMQYFSPNASVIDDYGEEQSMNEYMLDHAAWIVANKLQVETSFKTADFLVYWDGGYHVRGMLDIVSYGCNTDEMGHTIPAGIDLGSDGQYVFDITLFPFSQNSTVPYQIKSFEVVTE